MALADYLGAYAQGWCSGDIDTLVGSLSDGYVLDDPNAGKIAKADIADYFAKFIDSVASLRGPTSDEPLMEITEVATNEADGVLTAWAWWAVPGTDLQGGGLIKVGENGVISERLTYYTALPA